MTYAGFEIERRGSRWIATRTTRTAIHKLWPRRSLVEMKAAIDSYLADLSTEELFAL